MAVLAFIYRIFGLNSIKGRRRLKSRMRGVFMKKTKIINHGRSNRLTINEGTRIYNTKIEFFGDGCEVIIDSGCVLKNVEIWISDKSKIEIGHNSHFAGSTHLACIEGRIIHIGAKCLFSNEITLRTGDSHSVVDMEGKRINPSADIFIEDHVWVGHRVIILKGAKIGHDSIIGTGALVTGKEYKPNIILAGVPAKAIRENVNWDPNLL